MKTILRSACILFPVVILGLSSRAFGQPATAGSALHFFSGQNSYATVPGFGNDMPTNEITVEFWQRTAPYQGEATMSLTPDVVTNRFNLHVPYLDGNVYWDFGDITGQGRLSYASPITMLASWQHFAFVASSSGSNSPYGAGVSYMAIYRNGVLEAQKTGMTPFMPADEDLTLGALVDEGLYFSGDLDEVRIWNMARSQSDIQSTMHGTLTGNESGLFAYWRLDEGSGATAADATGNGYDASLTNQPVWVFSSAPIDTPVLALNGPNSVAIGCATPYVEPGARAMATPLGVGVGPQYGLAIRPDGSLAGWGGALFDISRNYFKANSGGSILYSRLDAISAAHDYALALSQYSLPGNNDNVAGWGNGSVLNPSFGLATTPDVGVSAGFQHWMLLSASGTIQPYGANDLGQSTPPGGVQGATVAIAAGGYHSLALEANGSVVAWGDNNDINGMYAGQSTPPVGLSNVVAIAAGGFHSLALIGDGTVVGWGSDNDGNGDYVGQATPPTGLSNVVAIAAGLYFSLALQADGTVVAWGDDSYNQTNIPASVSNIIAIAAGDVSAAVLRADRTVISWGDGFLGQIPVATNANTLSVTITGTVNTNTPGTYYLYYNSATNEYGRAAGQLVRTVVVGDVNPPSVTLLGPSPLSIVESNVFADPGATAYDTCVGDISSRIVVLGSVNTSIPGTYSLTYTATNQNGIVGSATRVVWVTPNIPYPTSLFPFSDAVNPAGMDTIVYDQYGLTTNYGSATSPQDLGAGNTPVPFSLTISNLLPGTTYHYRLVTISGGATNYGPDMTFTPSPYIHLVPGDLDSDGIVDQNELNIVLTNYWPYSPWLLITNAVGISTTNVLFSLPDAVSNGFDLSVQYSTNLIDWNYVGPAHQRYQFFDPQGTNGPIRYYRLRWP